MPMLYLLLNISSSNGLKNLPLVEVVIITADFVIRLLCGGKLTDANISNALLLAVISSSMFLSFGKRCNELRKGISTRKDSMEFLDKIMYF